MDIESYFRSLSAELESLQNRVRHFIQSAHWLTDGEWKESVLRSVLVRKLPDTVKIGRGFVITRQGVSSQCDILLYKASVPVLFREGDLVFLTPDAVLGIIEVKSRTDKTVLENVIDRFSGIGRKLGSHRAHCFFGLFSYESAVGQDSDILHVLKTKCTHESNIVDLIALGPHTFVRWWKFSPHDHDRHYEKWHAYDLNRMAAGYFIANVIDSVSPESVGGNEWLWFPTLGKESHKTGEVAFVHGLSSSDG